MKNELLSLPQNLKRTRKSLQADCARTSVSFLNFILLVSFCLQLLRVKSHNVNLYAVKKV